MVTVRGKALINRQVPEEYGRKCCDARTRASAKLRSPIKLGTWHNDPDLLETAVVTAARDSVFQGHLTPGPEELRISCAWLRHAGEHLKSKGGFDAATLPPGFPRPEDL
jgi:hypothetical protein